MLKKSYHSVAIRKPEWQVHKSFTLAASNIRDDALQSLCYCLFAPYIYIWALFFAHIPFVVNRTFNATLTKRLQQYHKTYVIGFLSKKKLKTQKITVLSQGGQPFACHTPCNMLQHVTLDEARLCLMEFYYLTIRKHKKVST